MSIPSSLNEAMIRGYATSQSWQKGEDYYFNGCVRSITERGGMITAEVSGNHYKPYQVNLSFEGEELDTCYCSCPYDYGGICKHQVATLLVCLREPHKLEPRPTIEQILDRLNEVQTQALIQQLVAKKPELINDIEHFANRVAPSVTVETQTDHISRKVTVNPSSIRSRVYYILKDSENAYEYGEYIEEDFTTEEIENLIEEAQEFSQQGDSWNAITMLTAITEACVENWHLVEDYGVDYDNVASTLNKVWSEILLNTEDISEAEKVDLEVNFEFWNNQWEGYFAMAAAALSQGWDYPPLKQILQGDIVSLWSEETPRYAEKLALLRLEILQQQHKFTEYLHLADATGLVAEYLTMLVSLDRVSEAMQYAQSKMNTMEQALAFSKALVYEQNAQPEALAIAKRGLNLPGNCQYNLAGWMSQIAEEIGDTVTAIQGKIKAFQEEPTFSSYRKIEQLAADNWTNIKEEVLAALAKSDGWRVKEAKIDIYLYEGLIEKAISLVNNLAYYEQSLVHKVMDAAINTHPDWVISNACPRAESIMKEGKAKYYENAIEWLKKARNAYISSNRKQEWLDYRTKLMTVHCRKRKFIGLMKKEVI